MLASGLNGQRLRRNELTLGCRCRANASQVVTASGGGAADGDFAPDPVVNY
jgi:hypothetical protein